MSNDPIIVEHVYDAPAEMVWKAISDVDQMREWYFDVSDFKAEIGFEFSFEGKTEKGICYNHLCKVTEVEPGRRLTYSWRYEGWAGDSFVTWELMPEGDKTRLRLTHAGLETFPKENPDLARENFVGGWNAITGELLPQYLEKQKATN